MCIYVYTCVYVCVYMCVYIYIYIYTNQKGPGAGAQRARPHQRPGPG